MNLIKKIKFGFKSAEDIEKEWEKVRDAMRQVETTRLKNFQDIEIQKENLNKLKQQQQDEIELLKKDNQEQLNKAMHQVETIRFKNLQDLEIEKENLNKLKQQQQDEIELLKKENHEQLNKAMQEGEIERQENFKKIELEHKKIVALKKQHEEQIKKQNIIFDNRAKELEELNQRLIRDTNAIEPAWQKILAESSAISNEKKSIDNNRKQIIEEWDKILEFYPEIKKAYIEKAAVAIDKQIFTGESFSGMDPDVIAKLHEKKMKVQSGGEDTIRYVRKDHPNLHGHKEE
jgi:hypothetical protein